ADYNALNKYGPGMYTSDEDPELIDYPRVVNQTIERSNVNMTEEFTGILASQRSLQTASQAFKIYDMINEKAVTEIGKIE
ncbi:MAG TPA: hypothetical protein DHU59_08795, partial [Clostridiales bacterium]|nr:hypothetical protein [Clostridiales bacterium]